jgi:shikimate dehydrogenase
MERDINELPTEGRPLSAESGIAALAGERLPLYRQWCDHSINVRGIEQTAADIYKLLII